MKCALPGCDRACTHRVWCNTHYARWLRNGGPRVRSRKRVDAKRRVCRMDGCKYLRKGHGLCSFHLACVMGTAEETARPRSNGQPYLPPLERFFAKVDVGDCWVWTGATDRGYAKFRPNGKTVRGHRWLFEQLVGPVPDGYVLDHLCRVRRCINPDHLQPVRQRLNMQRSPAGTRGTRSQQRIGEGEALIAADCGLSECPGSGRRHQQETPRTVTFAVTCCPWRPYKNGV